MAIATRPAVRARAAEDALLEVDDLQVEFHTPDGVAQAVNGLSFELHAGEVPAVVGESGCGKSVSALSMLGLIPTPPGRIAVGRVVLDGRDLLSLLEREMQSVRGKDVSMIFQEPMTSLNPVLTIGYQIAEAVRRHEGLARQPAHERTTTMLDMVRIPEPERRASQFPHQLSGGMRQRAMIAMALSCNPKVLIADEPTTALDVTIQAQILNLIKDIQSRLGTAVILITHDLGVVAETADRVVVMYAGRKVEQAGVFELFERPLHPYTSGLMASVPRLNLGEAFADQQARLAEIDGIVPALTELPTGCAFAPRCPHADRRCDSQPPLEEVRAGHFAACWHAGRLAESKT